MKPLAIVMKTLFTSAFAFTHHSSHSIKRQQFFSFSQCLTFHKNKFIGFDNNHQHNHRHHDVKLQKHLYSTTNNVHDEIGTNQTYNSINQSRSSGNTTTTSIQTSYPSKQIIPSLSSPSSDTKQKYTSQSPPPLPKPSEFPSWAYESRDFFHFEILHQSTKSQARVGRIHTPHGIIDTPSFVAVATNAALKGVDFRQADVANQQLIFCNTYHLLLQPGREVIQKAGGLHKFTNRQGSGTNPTNGSGSGSGGGGGGPFITDSGGFQVFSLAYGSVAEELSSKGELKRASTNSKYKQQEFMSGKDAVQVTEDGVRFRSYRDGSRFLLTPESTVQAQKDFGADIIIPLDELPPYHISKDQLSESVDRSHRWEARSLTEHLKDVKDQAMYAVIHGGVDKQQRTKSVNYLTSLPFDGYAIGGSLGSNREELKELLTWMMPLFEEEERVRTKPRHLLGIADEINIRNAVPMGLDTMDSCYPTRLSRHGTLLTKKGKIHITQGKHKQAYGIPIDEGCQCSTCTHYDRAYLHHLFKASEPLAMMLGTIHNIYYMNDMMKQIRQDILDNKI